jgi:hypothetical protein
MKILLFLLLLALPLSATSEVVRGPNGIWYGNMCQTQRGWQYVQFQPVGSVCFASQFNLWGYILNR